MEKLNNEDEKISVDFTLKFINKHLEGIDEQSKQKALDTLNSPKLRGFVLHVIGKTNGSIPILDIIELCKVYRFQVDALDELLIYLKKRQDIKNYIEGSFGNETLKFARATYMHEVFLLEYDGGKSDQREISLIYWNKYKEKHPGTPGGFEQITSDNYSNYLRNLPGYAGWFSRQDTKFEESIIELRILKQILDKFKGSPDTLSQRRAMGQGGGSIKGKRRYKKSSRRKSSKRKSLKRKSLKKKKSTKRKKRKRKTKRMR